MIYSLIGRVLDREGGYVDHPADRGGPTNMGITLKTLSDWRNDAEITAQDVEALTRDEAVQIYYENYWKAPQFYSLGRGCLVEDLLFDCAVHHGPTQAVKFLQRVVGTRPDGVLGNITRAVANTMPDKHLLAGVVGERMIFIGNLITRDPRQAAFAHGWMRRVASFVQTIPLA